MKVYTRKGYVLGHRCHLQHSGNRRYALAVRRFAECCGCRNFVVASDLTFASRPEALAAERAVSGPRWPMDSAASVVRAMEASR